MKLIKYTLFFAVLLLTGGEAFAQDKTEKSNVEKALNLLSILALFGALLITYKYKKRSDNV